MQAPEFFARVVTSRLNCGRREILHRSCLNWLKARKFFSQCYVYRSVHRKKRFTSFPSPAGMSLTKLPLGRNISVMTLLFPPRESLVVTSRLGTGNSRTFFYGVFTRVSFWIQIQVFIKGTLATSENYERCTQKMKTTLFQPGFLNREWVLK